MERLFVYGTLAPGRVNHRILEDIPGHWQPAMIKGKLVDQGWGAELGCPAIVPSDEGEEVEGFVFSSEHLSEHWAMLDEFEGAGYKRICAPLTLEGGEKTEAYVYALNNAIK